MFDGSKEPSWQGHYCSGAIYHPNGNDVALHHGKYVAALGYLPDKS